MQERKCLIHQHNIVACDLNPLIQGDQKYLCTQCLTQYIPQWNWITLNSDVEEKVVKMKLSQYDLKKKQIQEHLLRLSFVQQEIVEFQKYINDRITKTIDLFEKRIEEILYELDQLMEPSLETIDEQDLTHLSDSILQDFSVTIQKAKDQELAFAEVIEKQFQKLQCKDKIRDLSKNLEKLLPKNSIEIPKINFNLSEKLNSQKTESLTHCCQVHKKEFIMANLEAGEFNQRLYCVYCIQESKSKLTPLNEVDRLWQIHKYKINEYQKSSQMKRLEKSKKIEQIFEDYIKENQFILLKLKQKIESQCKANQNKLEYLELFKDSRSLLQLNLQEIQTILSDLASDIEEIQEEQWLEIYKEDLEFEQELSSRFLEIENNCSNCISLIDQTNQMSIQKVVSMDGLFNSSKLKSLENFLEDLTSQKLYPEEFNMLIDYLYNQSQKYNKIWKSIYDKVKGQLPLQIDKELDESQEQVNVQILTALKKNIIFNNDVSEKDTQTNCNLTFQQLHINQKYPRIKKIILTANQLNTQFNQSIKTISPDADYIKNLKFSTTFKHTIINISEDRKVAQTTPSNECLFAVCLVDQPIPRNGIFTMEIKLKTIKHVMIGICQKGQIKGDYNFSNYSTTGHGFYVLYGYNGYMYSHHDSQQNQQRGGFCFTSEDTISVSVNMQTQLLTWKNVAKKYSCSLQFQPSYDLYFCFIIYQSTQISEIEII